MYTKKGWIPCEETSPSLYNLPQYLCLVLGLSYTCNSITRYM